jgi:hypothetical protein
MVEELKESVGKGFPNGQTRKKKFVSVNAVGYQVGSTPP